LTVVTTYMRTTLDRPQVGLLDQRDGLLWVPRRRGSDGAVDVGVRAGELDAWRLRPDTAMTGLVPPCQAAKPQRSASV
jgi:hypothetical protein